MKKDLQQSVFQEEQQESYMISQSQENTEEVGTIGEMGIDAHSRINMVNNEIGKKGENKG
jgi:hypothetical protein